jgi:hypothetical protein
MKFIELLKKYKVYILAGLLAIFFFRSCSKSTSARKSEEMVTQQEVVIDSLQNIVNGYPSNLKKEKIKIHSEYDNYISEKDRGEQLMELHMMIKKNLKELQDEK